MAKYKNALPKIPARGWFDEGDKGEEVKKLQRVINWANTGSIVKALVVDGEVGDLTIAAVAFFQEINQIPIDGQFGPDCLKTVKALDLTGSVKAVNWAVSISKDNRFTYGSGERAHRSGCYFCKTNIGPRKSNKERKGESHYVKDSKGHKHTYAKTYCCNTFITAAFAHGAKDKEIYKICHAGSCCGMEPKDWLRSKNFKKVGTCKGVAYSKLKMGDVILNPDHVWMYIGKGKLVEASGNDWSTKSISTKATAKKRYGEEQERKGAYVMRYTG